MSNAIRYDALLVRDLAAELNAALAGARLDAAFLDRAALNVALRTRAGRRGAPQPPSLLWQLHPSSGRLLTGTADTTGGRVQLRAPSPIVRVHAPPDERILFIELDAGDAPGGVARRIIIELITNQWNALATGAEDRIIAVLRERVTRERELRAGVRYVAPPASARPGAQTPLPLAEWLAVLTAVPPGERLRAVLKFAYVSPLNAAAILGDGDVTAAEHALVRAHERYVALVWSDTREAVLLEEQGRAQPYSVRIGTGTSMPSLLDAMAAAAPAADADAAVDAALSQIAERLESLVRREQRLNAEREGAAADAEQARHRADVLMTQLQRVKRGASSVELQDYDGSTFVLELDPTLDAARNAGKLYEAARKRARAAARIPRLLADAARERARLEDLAARVRDGSAMPEELEALRRSRAAAARARQRPLPYREYRTSRGTEVRVGRGARANDELTLRHSAGTDIWLHARDVAGAHVILRWPHAGANPPASDIAEAAVLAALHSRARTSGAVAVDWTRRKYVRKPRGSPPGSVIPERVRTVFVQPDPAVEERMRAGDLF